MRYALVPLCVILLTVTTRAQAPLSGQPAPTAAQAKPAEKAAPPAAEYSDLDKAELQILALQDMVRELSDQLGQCRTQLAPLVSAKNAEALPKVREETIARIEARHPGFIVDRKTGQLVPKPAEPPKAEPAPAKATKAPAAPETPAPPKK